MVDCLAALYEALPAEQELLVEYKLFEPAFYATDLADWGSALLVCQQLGDRATVLVDLGHHAQGANVEQIVAILDDERTARRLSLQQPQVRRRRPDRRLGQPVRAVPDLRRAHRPGRTMPRLTIDQSHNVEAKVEAMVLSVVNLQEAYAKALLVDRRALAAAQQAGDVLGGHELLLDAYHIDVRPLCGCVRERSGAAPDPIAAFRASGYVARAAEQRGGIRV